MSNQSAANQHAEDHIDKSGERLLRAMSKKGAQLIANGLYVKHVLEHVKTGGKPGLITLMVCLFASLVFRRTSLSR